MGRRQLPNPSVPLLPPPLWQVPASGVTSCDTRGCPLYLENRKGRWEAGEWAQGVAQAGVGMEGPRLLEEDRPHHTEHLCTGFMGEFLGQWKTRPNSSNCETLPRTLQGEGGTSELGTPCPHSGHMLTPAAPTPSPAPGISPKIRWYPHSKGCSSHFAQR